MTKSAERQSASNAQLITPTNSVESQVKDKIATARQTLPALLQACANQRQSALLKITKVLTEQVETILSANAQDIANAQNQSLSNALIDRLRLTPERVVAMADGVKQLALAPDILGEISRLQTQSRGFQVGKMRTPLGVVGMIYESRPNVTIDAAAICIKSGNALILRGGKEALHSNQALMYCLHMALADSDLPVDAVQFIDTPEREAVNLMLAAVGGIDVIIPRGGKNLVAAISEHARVPVIKHLEGVCHVYIDEYAPQDMALAIAVNAKTYRYGICGAMETLLIHERQLAACGEDLIRQFSEKGVELRVCGKIHDQYGSEYPQLKHADETDWHSEYLAPILSVKVVADLDAAIAHINHYGSQHTDAIVTDSLASQRRFLQCVDSASVMVNTPTCFADGFEYGLGAEIGISTNKLHVRGPVGVAGLTCEKYVVLGQGELRD